MTGSIGVVLLAAGQGRRLPGAVRKALRPVAGKPLFRHALDLFARFPGVGAIVLVAPAGDLASVRRLAAGTGRGRRAVPVRIVSGGDVRPESVRLGLAALPAEIRWVAIHDAARPCLTVALVRRVVAAARRGGKRGGAIPALPVAETVKRVRRGLVVGTVDRADLWCAQTPQVFSRAALERAFSGSRGGHRAWTDDARAFETLGLPVRIVPGERRNIKVTTPEDLALAGFFLEKGSSRSANRTR